MNGVKGVIAVSLLVNELFEASGVPGHEWGGVGEGRGLDKNVVLCCDGVRQDQDEAKICSLILFSTCSCEEKND